jgi:hypothetical protein
LVPLAQFRREACTAAALAVHKLRGWPDDPSLWRTAAGFLASPKRFPFKSLAEWNDFRHG